MCRKQETEPNLNRTDCTSMSPLPLSFFFLPLFPLVLGLFQTFRRSQDRRVRRSVGRSVTWGPGINFLFSCLALLNSRATDCFRHSTGFNTFNPKVISSELRVWRGSRGGNNVWVVKSRNLGSIFFGKSHTLIGYARRLTVSRETCLGTRKCDSY